MEFDQFQSFADLFGCWVEKPPHAYLGHPLSVGYLGIWLLKYLRSYLSLGEDYYEGGSFRFSDLLLIRFFIVQQV